MSSVTPIPGGNDNDLGNATATQQPAVYVVSEAGDYYVGVMISLFLAIGVLVLFFVQLVVRSKVRQTTLSTARYRVRHDAVHIATKQFDPRKKIVEKSVEVLQYKIENPPQTGRVIPCIMRDQRDERAEAKRMLDKLRAALPHSNFGDTTQRMTMRTAVGCIDKFLSPSQVQRFLSIYESVLFGVHFGDGSEGDVSAEDIAFMHSFFHNSIMKEIS